MDSLLKVLTDLEGLFINFDLFFFAGIFCGVLLYLFTVGKDHGVILTLSLYLAAATLVFLPFLSDIAFLGIASHHIQLFLLIVLIALFAILQLRNGFFEPSIVPSGWENLVFAVIFSGAFMFIVLGFLPTELQSDLSTTTQTVFLRQPWSNLWFTLPIFTLLFLKGDA